MRLFRWSDTTHGGNRRIYALKISDNPSVNEAEREILYMGLHHGRELLSASIAMAWIRRLTQSYVAGDPAITDLVDNAELWIIPVVNPDGYSMAVSELGQGANVTWRKNTRPALDLDADDNFVQGVGVDPNRNYGFAHIRSILGNNLPLVPPDKEYSGYQLCSSSNAFCNFYSPTSDTYPGLVQFSEREAVAVRGLADNEFFSHADEVDGFLCSLSWHTGANGLVLYPMNQTYIVDNGLDPNDRPFFDVVADAYANASGYDSVQDLYPTSPPGVTGYAVYGTSDDWLYKHNDIFALTIEAFSVLEGKTSDSDYFPENFGEFNAAVQNNLAGAAAFSEACSLSGIVP